MEYRESINSTTEGDMNNGSHWYECDGTAKHWIEKKDGTGNRPTTLADGKKLNLLPGVSSILKTLAKPQLQDWTTRQAVMAVVTAPDVPGEALDAKVTRILEAEEQHREEAAKAADLGTRIHDAIAGYFAGKSTSPELDPYIAPAIRELEKGTFMESEKVLVGLGYAGRTDLLQNDVLHGEAIVRIWDFKSCKNLPTKGAYPEARLQCAAYAQALETKWGMEGHTMLRKIVTANLYISTTEPGKFLVCEHEDWKRTYEEGFKPLVKFWQWQNNYCPRQEELWAHLAGTALPRKPIVPELPAHPIMAGRPIPPVRVMPKEI